MRRYKDISELIGMDPEKTYIGGGFRRDRYTIRDISIDKYLLIAMCDVEGLYAGTELFHLTQPAAYNMGAQLAVGLYIANKGISRQQKGVNFYMAKYSTEWHRQVRHHKNIRYEIEFTHIVSSPRKDKLIGRFDIADGSSTGEFEGIIDFSDGD